MLDFMRDYYNYVKNIEEQRVIYSERMFKHICELIDNRKFSESAYIEYLDNDLYNMQIIYQNVIITWDFDGWSIRRFKIKSDPDSMESDILNVEIEITDVYGNILKSKVKALQNLIEFLS